MHERHGFQGKGPEFWRKAGPLIKILIIVAALAVFAGLLTLLGIIFVSLWNWLMPTIFRLPTITFWQGWGLMILSSILFKRSPSGKHFSEEQRRKRALRERMRSAEDEERRGEKTGGEAANADE